MQVKISQNHSKLDYVMEVPVREIRLRVLLRVILLGLGGDVVVCDGVVVGVVVVVE